MLNNNRHRLVGLLSTPDGRKILCKEFNDAGFPVEIDEIHHISGALLNWFD